MFYRRFRHQTESDMGEGYAPAWIPNADPVGGPGAAHDVLEHPPHCKVGGFEGEMIAFGAMHFVRGHSAYNWRLSNIFNAQRSDIQYFYRDGVIYGDQTLREPPKPPRKASNVVDYGFDEGAMHSELVHMFDEDLPRELYTENQAILDDLKQNGELYTDRILGWMRIGYIKAVNRYQGKWGLQKWQLAETFELVQKEFDRALLCADPDSGDEILLGIDFERRSVIAKVTPSTVNQW